MMGGLHTWLRSFSREERLTSLFDHCPVVRTSSRVLSLKSDDTIGRHWQTLVGGLRPHEGLGLRVGVSTGGPDGSREGVTTGVHAPAQLAPSVARTNVPPE